MDTLFTLCYCLVSLSIVVVYTARTTGVMEKNFGFELICDLHLCYIFYFVEHSIVVAMSSHLKVSFI